VASADPTLSGSQLASEVEARFGVNLCDSAWKKDPV